MPPSLIYIILALQNMKGLVIFVSFLGRHLEVTSPAFYTLAIEEVQLLYHLGKSQLCKRTLQDILDPVGQFLSITRAANKPAFPEKAIQLIERCEQCSSRGLLHLLTVYEQYSS